MHIVSLLLVVLRFGTRTRSSSHLLDPAGQIAVQHDGWPLAGRYPTSAWDAGEIVADTHTLDTSSITPGAADAAQVAVGLYDLATLRRLPVTVAGRRVAEDRLLLAISNPP